MKIIARIHTDFTDKFGIPRQSGMVPEITGRIVFEPEYRNITALKGLEGFNYIWLIWEFSRSVRDDWSPTVRPPRLGGDTRVGVFATRSPFRPNPIGLSCVKLQKIQQEKDGPVIYVSGVDILDGTPIYDIKPYLPHSDMKSDATGGFADRFSGYRLDVVIAPDVECDMSEDRKAALTGALSLDPRPSYQDDPDRIYGMDFAGYNVKFKVDGSVLTVIKITNCQP